MQKRSFDRIFTNLDVRYFCGSIIHNGTVTNLSEKGMFIRTRMDFPFDSIFDLLIPLDEEVLHVPVKVRRIVKTDNFYDGIGVELLNPPQNYLKFVNNLKLTE